jgi:foldase protein PrsA
MIRISRIPLKLLSVMTAAGLGAAVISGCGEAVPSDSVAKVGDTEVKKSEFDKWLKVNARAGQRQGGQAAVPDPPSFTRCVEAKRRQPLPKGMKGTKPPASELKRQCKQEYDQLKEATMQFVLQAQWVQQEAEEQNLKVPQSEVVRSFQTQKKAAFKTDEEYKKFLRTSGMTEQEVLYRIRIDTIQQKLNEKVRKGTKVNVSDAELKRYYEKNKKRFGQPELREVNVVLTKSKAEADRARQAVEDGQSFKRVAERYSIDETSKRQGGKTLAAKGQQARPLDNAVFKAPKGELQGPVKTVFGYYVFEVTKVTKASQQSFEQAKPSVENLLRSERQQKAVDAYQKRFREKYRDMTMCAEAYKVPQCKNGPKEKPDAGTGPGGAPGQGGQSQPQPQQPQQQPPQQPQQPQRKGKE